jgi:hypothetical protein
LPRSLPEVKDTFRPPEGKDWEQAVTESYGSYGGSVINMKEAIAKL